MAMLNGVRVFGLVSGLAAGITYVSKRSNSAQMVELSSKEVLNRHSSEIKSKGVTCAVNLKYTRVISAAEELTNLCMLKYGAPGCIVAVSVDGKLVWSRGFGFSDVENSITCTPDTVMRIASISKSLTSVAVAKLWEEGTLDLDCSVQEYVPSFPQKTFQEEPVSITTRQLLTHMGCIRHYKKLHEKEVEGVGDGRYREFHSTKLYKTVTDALKLFAGDDLLCKPGKKFLYTTHGWTLISAVIEGASGKSYLDYMKDSVLDPLELRCVWADHHAPLIRRRSK
jgi:serine beta-lactamase-like protein LACTB